MTPSPLQIVVGLGNPGLAYHETRHNIGFMILDEVHRRYRFSSWTKKFRAEVASGTIKGQKLLLLKPLTFMNLSGESVVQALHFYKLGPEALLVAHDDLALEPGKLRIKMGGGAGGHNGLRSLDRHCGANYRRLKCGIGHPGTPDSVHNYVLGAFSKAEKAWLSPLLEQIAQHFPLLLARENASFLNAIYKATKGQPKEKGENYGI